MDASFLLQLGMGNIKFFRKQTESFNNFVKAVNTSISSYTKHQLTKGTMVNRGQMGLYWTTMQVEIE